jgi:hypothetical protein
VTVRSGVNQWTVVDKFWNLLKEESISWKSNYLPTVFTVLP